MAKFFQFWKNNYISCAFITLGWYFMVTGQSLVLYSRLHLLVRDARKLKWILCMIIADVFLFHIPTTVFTFGVGLSFSSWPFHVPNPKTTRIGGPLILNSQTQTKRQSSRPCTT